MKVIYLVTHFISGNRMGSLISLNIQLSLSDLDPFRPAVATVYMYGLHANPPFKVFA